MLQHYRSKQREYLHWRSQQEEKQEKPGYIAPHLRDIRNEWFTKRLDKYGKELLREEALRSEGISYSAESSGESEAAAHKVWRWLISDEEEEQREQPLHREAK